jgi:protein-S-isoprenylcysteine O-methyltransferase Ste14
MSNPPDGWRLWGRRPADFVLFGVTAVELALLIKLSPGLSVTEWIYVCSNLLVLVLALMRHSAQAQDRSVVTVAAVLVSYTYSYGQVALLHWFPGHEGRPDAAFFVVLAGASMSLVSLISLGRSFGVRPALRGLSTRGTYRVVRHPLYLAYVIQDIGYNLHEWSVGTLALVALGWASLIYRIQAEERVLSQSARWKSYSQRVRYRLVPGLW